MTDFSRMIAIPQHEYAQLTTVQNARQPATEQFYRLENDYQKNAQIYDPQRSVALQSQTIEQMKSLKDQMRNYLSISTPKPFRTRADRLLESVLPHLKINEVGELVKPDGTVIPSSQFEDLIQHAVRDRRRKFTPAGWEYFLELLKTYNIPKSSLSGETIDEMTRPPKKAITSSTTSKFPVYSKPSKIPVRVPTPASTRPRGRPRTSKIKLSPDSYAIKAVKQSLIKRRRAPPQKFILSEYSSK